MYHVFPGSKLKVFSSLEDTTKESQRRVSFCVKTQDGKICCSGFCIFHKKPLDIQKSMNYVKDSAVNIFLDRFEKLDPESKAKLGNKVYLN